MKRDYYEVLGIGRDADQAKIKDAFRELAMMYHPDRDKSPEAEEKFKEIAEAYAVLSDADKRRQYDSGGFDGMPDFSVEDLFRNLDLGDVFAGMHAGFGGNGIFDSLFGGRDQGPARGRNIEVQVTVPLEMIDRGGEQPVRVAHPARCPVCNGARVEAGSSPRECKACDGSGQKVVSRKGSKGRGNVTFQQISTCPACHGQGETIDKPCQRCQGSGQIEKLESLTVKIPAGADEGMMLRIPGHGMPSADPKGLPGDLHVIVRSAADDRFDRMGADLWRTESINAAEAVLGTQIDVPTLDGTVTVTVPPGTQSDEVLRLHDKGLAHFGSGQRGDMNLRMRIAIPKNPSGEERELYRRLLELDKAQMTDSARKTN